MGGIVGFLVFVILIILIANIKIVPQASAFVLERLGAYRATWSTGLHFQMPLFGALGCHCP